MTQGTERQIKDFLEGQPEFAFEEYQRERGENFCPHTERCQKIKDGKCKGVVWCPIYHGDWEGSHSVSKYSGYRRIVEGTKMLGLVEYYIKNGNKL